MKSAVIVFPGSNCDRDLAVAIEEVTGSAPTMLWHRETELPDGVARNANLPDSAPATDANRTIKPDWLVLIGICTHLGCIPLFNQGEFGGYLCPCHGSQYDTAGRIRKGPAPENLFIPPYAFMNDTRIKIG